MARRVRSVVPQCHSALSVLCICTMHQRIVLANSLDAFLTYSGSVAEMA